MIETLYEDDYLIAINKKSGMLSIPSRDGSTDDLFSILKIKYNPLFIIHRIDRDTSGVILYAKDAEVHKKMNQLFENHQICKKYLALLSGVPAEKEGHIENYIDENAQKMGSYKVSKKGKLAISDYKVLATYKKNSLVEVDIKTGRTHQIRVHAQFIGCPLAFDPVYNPMNGVFISKLKRNYRPKLEEEERSIINRLSLHASSMSFIHPITHQTIEIKSPLHQDFQKCIKILEKYN